MVGGGEGGFFPCTCLLFRCPGEGVVTPKEEPESHYGGVTAMSHERGVSAVCVCFLPPRVGGASASPYPIHRSTPSRLDQLATDKYTTGIPTITIPTDPTITSYLILI